MDNDNELHIYDITSNISMDKCKNSNALAMKLHLFCINPLIHNLVIIMNAW